MGTALVGSGMCRHARAESISGVPFIRLRSRTVHRDYGNSPPKRRFVRVARSAHVSREGGQPLGHLSVLEPTTGARNFVDSLELCQTS